MLLMLGDKLAALQAQLFFVCIGASRDARVLIVSLEGLLVEVHLSKGGAAGSARHGMATIVRFTRHGSFL